jgi:hypothetical protein
MRKFIITALAAATGFVAVVAPASARDRVSAQPLTRTQAKQVLVQMLDRSPGNEIADGNAADYARHLVHGTVVSAGAFSEGSHAAQRLGVNAVLFDVSFIVNVKRPNGVKDVVVVPAQVLVQRGWDRSTYVKVVPCRSLA